MTVEKKLISKKKPFYPISKKLENFLKHHDRWINDVISYDDLLRYTDSINIYDKNDKDTLWVRLIYNESERNEIDENLKITYTLLHSDGNPTSIPYLNIYSVDYCTFGNSKPFRIKIRNILNDNFTYFYVKKTDASRIYGIEFEHMLSPRNLNFLVNRSSLIEEHIAGIPGDVFIKEYLPKCSEYQKSQIAKEYVKFNERCMIRLLGDMRSYNYVVIPIHDFDQVIYKIRAIDFDQQSFEGKFNIYIPTNSFYEDVYLDIKAKEDTLVLHKNTIPLHKSIRISTDVSNYNDEDINKLYIGRLNYKKEPYYNFTSRKGNKLTAYTKTLGSFVLVTDKSDPKIKALNFEDNKWISKNKTLKIKITDVLSGISSYRATINGKFILMEYNYKKDVLTYDFDDQIISESENNLKLIVIDNVGNNATFEATFFRK